jgi:hypothetical protein
MQRLSATELSIPSHANQLLEHDRVFCNAPSEIGRLLTGFSTLRPGKIPWLGWLNALFIACVFGAMGCGFAYMIVYFDGPTWLYPLFFLTCAAGTFYVFAPAARITYVGEQGIFIWQRKLGKESEQTILFQDDIKLLVRQTQSFDHGIYTGTEYGFAFLTPDLKDKLIIDGRYFSLKDNVSPDKEFYFGKSAEQAFTAALLPRLLQQIKEGKSRAFPIENGPTLTLTAQSIVIEHKGKSETIPLPDIDRVTVQKGTIGIIRKGAKSGILGIGREGIHGFEYASFPNAQLFFQALTHLLQR